MNRKIKIFIVLMLVASAGIAPVVANPIDDMVGGIRNIFSKIFTLSFAPSGIGDITVDGYSVSFTFNGNAWWQAVLLNSNGVEEAYITNMYGNSRGTLVARSTGEHTLKVYSGTDRSFMAYPINLYGYEKVTVSAPVVVQPVITTVVPPQTPGTVDNSRPKPTIIPPAISRLSKMIVTWFRGLTGLSIMGGESVEIILNQPYNSSVSLEFAAYDSCNVDNPPDRCSMKYAEWFVVDPGRKLVKESGWSSELKDSPYTANIYFVPRGPGTYYVVALLVRQDYTYTASGWSMKEVVEKKELQKVRVVRQAPPPSDGSRPSRPPGNFFGGWLSGIKTLIPGF